MLCMSPIMSCSSCTDSGHLTKKDPDVVNTVDIITPPEEIERTVIKNKTHGKTVVKMTKKQGVYEIPIEVNGMPMSFIFDTGAGTISISAAEAIVLQKQGSLTDDDILGVSQFTTATGEVSEGMFINLKTVKIGDRVLENIEASVVHNLEAPLLLGQSVLEEFGKVSIDYTKNEIILE